MKSTAIVVAAFVALLFTGCSLNQNINSLSAQKKFEIYHSVKDEIENYKTEASTYYNNKYFYKAIQAYEKVNFYEGKDVYSQEFINKVKRRANANGIHFYKKAVRFSKKNRIKALYYVNLMMRNTPHFEKGLELKETLLEDKKVSTFISKKENSIEKLISANNLDIKTIVSLKKAMKSLSYYDNDNAVLLKAENKIANEHPRLVKKAINLYNQEKFIEAKKEFNLLSSIYPKSKTINTYLYNIKQKERLQEAKEYLAKKEYNKALQSAKSVLKINKYNKEAKEIIDTSIVAKCHLTNNLEKEGIDYYINQRFDDAKKAFEKIISCKPDDRKAIAYLKKIKQQLNTINKLQ